MHIGFLIRALDVGGSERQLLNLAEGLALRGHKVVIYSLYPGVMDAEVKKSQLVHLEKKGRWDFFFLFRLRRKIKSLDVVYSFLPTQNIFASLAGLLGGPQIIWGIRAADMPLHQYSWIDRVIFRLQCLLSFQPQAVVFNSEAGKNFHMEKFFFRVPFRVIRNGVDTNKFSRNSATKFRNQYHISPETFLIGYVGRLDPVKDHRLFFLTLVELKKRGFHFFAVIMGDGPLRESLRTLSGELGLNAHLQFIDKYNQMPDAYSAFDLSCLFSLSEGCPNVVAEAMACETPCLVTSEAGDGPWLVGREEFIAQSREPSHLADKIQKIHDGWEKTRGAELRKRIQNELSIEKLLTTTEQVLS